MTPEAPVRLQDGRFVVRLPRMVESPYRAESQRVCPTVYQGRWSHILLREHEILQILVVHLLYQGEPVFQWSCVPNSSITPSNDIRFGGHGHFDVSEILNHG